MWPVASNSRTVLPGENGIAYTAGVWREEEVDEKGLTSGCGNCRSGGRKMRERRRENYDNQNVPN